MSASGHRIQACGIASVLVFLAGFAGNASAESYVRGFYDSTSIKPDSGAFTTKEKGVHLDLRQDAEYLPLFATFGADGTRERTPTGTNFDSTSKNWGYNLGFGYANHPSARTEWTFRVEYSHLRSSVGGPFSGCCNNRDAETAALGGYAWFNSVIKGFGEIAYTRAAQHKEKDYGAKLGLEFAITQSLRLFADYGYGKDEFGSAKGKVDTIEGGIKIPFGGKAGPTATQAAPEVAPVAPPPPKGTAGQAAKLKPGAQLRNQPRTAANPAPAAPDGSVVLQSDLENPEGTWWYVKSGEHYGWAHDTDLDLGAK